ANDANDANSEGHHETHETIKYRRVFGCLVCFVFSSFIWRTVDRCSASWIFVRADSRDSRANPVPPHAAGSSTTLMHLSRFSTNIGYALCALLSGTRCVITN